MVGRPPYLTSPSKTSNPFFSRTPALLSTMAWPVCCGLHAWGKKDEGRRQSKNKWRGMNVWADCIWANPLMGLEPWMWRYYLLLPSRHWHKIVDGLVVLVLYSWLETHSPPHKMHPKSPLQTKRGKKVHDLSEVQQPKAPTKITNRLKERSLHQLI
jgi:hypothetical protein